MLKWFNSQCRLVQFLLLLIPLVNWIIEVGVRWSKFLHSKNPFHLILALFVTIFGVFWGWIDMIWVLLFKHLTFAK